MTWRIVLLNFAQVQNTFINFAVPSTPMTNTRSHSLCEPWSVLENIFPDTSVALSKCMPLLVVDVSLEHAGTATYCHSFPAYSISLMLSRMSGCRGHDVQQGRWWRVPATRIPSKKKSSALDSIGDLHLTSVSQASVPLPLTNT